MKLLSITARNFKGHTFTEKLNPVTIFGGPNFAGKTARLDAIRLLLLGHLPELGSSNRATFGLSSGAEMSVEGEFDEGTVLRAWRAEGNSIKAIASGTGTVLSQLELAGTINVMLDATTYFALSDRERVKFVFKHTRLSDEWTAPTILARLEQTLKDNPEVEPEAVADFMESIRTNLKIAPGKITDIQEVIGVMLLAAEMFERNEKDYAGRMEKTVQGLAGLRSQDVHIDGTDASFAEAEDGWRAKANTARDELATLKARFDVVRSARARRAEINRFFALNRDVDTQRESLRTELDDREGRHAAIVAPTNEELQVHRDRIAEAKHMERGLLSNIGADLREIDRLQGEFAAIDSKTVCPYCGANGEGWKDIKKKEITARIMELAESKKDNETSLATFRTAMREQEELLRNGIEVANRKAGLAAQIYDLNRKIMSLGESVARADAYREEYDRLAPDDPELETAFTMRDLEIKQADAELLKIAQVRKMIAGRANDLKRLAEAEIARDKAQKHEAAGKAGKEVLREIQAEMVEKALVPLLELANRMYPKVMKSPLAYHDGEIGTWRAGVWVSHHTFSGVEKALTYAAVQAALSTMAPVRIMLIDELARIHNETFPQFLACVFSAIKGGMIDGFVGVDPSRRRAYLNIAEAGTDQGPPLLYREIQ